MLSMVLLVGVARGGVTTPTRTKHGDGVDGITNSNSSKINHISRLSGEINSGVELTSKQAEPIVPVVRHGREDGHKLLKINNSNSSMVTIVTIRLEATTTNHSSSPLTITVLITRDSPMGARQHSYTSHQWRDHREAQGHLLYRSYSPLKQTKVVMRGALLLGESTPLQSLVAERESLRANEQGKSSHRRHGNLGTDIHRSKVSQSSLLILLHIRSIMYRCIIMYMYMCMCTRN